MIDPIVRAACIRAAGKNDLPALLALYRHLHPDDPDVAPEDASAAWAAIMGSALITVIVAEVLGALVSSCMIAIVPNMTRGARPFGVIENVVTDPGYRRLGLGQAVLSTALARAWQADCYKVMLATGSKQEATLAFYRRAGFTQGGKTYFEARRP